MDVSDKERRLVGFALADQVLKEWIITPYGDNVAYKIECEDSANPDDCSISYGPKDKDHFEWTLIIDTKTWRLVQVGADN